ncbi:MAG: hypothetical protein ABIQ18_48565 [Umezawaea sp.]
MTARTGLGRAFAAAVGDWPEASKQVVRPTADAERDWRAAVGLRTEAEELPLPASLAVSEFHDADGEVRT